ncbi:MAG TPA: ABC transporter permease [Candidatus Limnocylindrales bacterium]|nr:ABC transporter permease [Candidatus Limnocylindrales bacterium]
MRLYLLRRLLQIIPTLIGITFITFVIINAAPGNPMSHLIDPHISREAIATRERQLGLDRSLTERYVIWLSELSRGNLGFSTRYRRAVTEIIRNRIGPTILLTFSSMLLSFIIAVPIGVYSAVHQHSRQDYIFTILTMAAVSIPVFFLGVALIKIFSFDLRLLPVGGMITAGETHSTWLVYASDVGRHLVLPLFVLSCASTASFVRYIRSSMLEVIRQDYVRTARAKGLSEKVVIYKHALRNALIPVITILGLSLPYLFSGAILTEVVFAWPGMGSLSVEAVMTRDYPLLMGINLILAMLVILGNLLADIFYAVVDPRIRHD